jgi:hypothetical protein
MADVVLIEGFKSRPVWKGATGVGHVQQAASDGRKQSVHPHSLFVWWKPLKHLPERVLLDVVGIHVCESARSNFLAQAVLGDEQVTVPRRIAVKQTAKHNRGDQRASHA